MQPEQPNPAPQPTPVPPQQPIYPSPDAGQPAPHPSHYDFIINPQAPPKGGIVKLPFSAGSRVGKIIIVLVGIFILLILFVLIKGALGGGTSNLASLTSVVNQQQELIHITTNANSITQQQTSLSVTNQNFTTTAQLAISSQQSQMLAYLKNNGHKISSKELNLGVSTSVDNELGAALSASTFDQTYSQIMQQQLTTYEQLLSKAYNLAPGVNGRRLLKADYAGAKLLLQQLSSPSS